MAQPIRYPELGAKLEATRLSKSVTTGRKYSLRSISQAIAVDYGHINRAFHGQSLPSREILINICKALGCNIQEATDIFNETDYRAPSADELEGEFVHYRNRKVA